jgi:thiamine biosynthesis protein ThiS
MKLSDGATIQDLLKLLEIDSRLVAVEQNLSIVTKSNYSQQRISDGDAIEIVHFVGGG